MRILNILPRNFATVIRDPLIGPFIVGISAGAFTTLGLSIKYYFLRKGQNLGSIKYLTYKIKYFIRIGHVANAALSKFFIKKNSSESTVRKNVREKVDNLRERILTCMFKIDSRIVKNKFSIKNNAVKKYQGTNNKIKDLQAYLKTNTNNDDLYGKIKAVADIGGENSAVQFAQQIINTVKDECVLKNSIIENEKVLIDVERELKNILNRDLKIHTWQVDLGVAFQWGAIVTLPAMLLVVLPSIKWVGVVSQVFCKFTLGRKFLELQQKI